MSDFRKIRENSSQRVKPTRVERPERSALGASLQSGKAQFVKNDKTCFQVEIHESDSAALE